MTKTTGFDTRVPQSILTYSTPLQTSKRTITKTDNQSANQWRPSAETHTAPNAIHGTRPCGRVVAIIATTVDEQPRDKGNGARPNNTVCDEISSASTARRDLFPHATHECQQEQHSSTGTIEPNDKRNGPKQERQDYVAKDRDNLGRAQIIARRPSPSRSKGSTCFRRRHNRQTDCLYGPLFVLLLLSDWSVGSNSLIDPSDRALCLTTNRAPGVSSTFPCALNSRQATIDKKKCTFVIINVTIEGSDFYRNYMSDRKNNKTKACGVVYPRYM